MWGSVGSMSTPMSATPFGAGIQPYRMSYLSMQNQSEEMSQISIMNHQKVAGGGPVSAATLVPAAGPVPCMPMFSPSPMMHPHMMYMNTMMQPFMAAQQQPQVLAQNKSVAASQRELKKRCSSCSRWKDFAVFDGLFTLLVCFFHPSVFDIRHQLSKRSVPPAPSLSPLLQTVPASLLHGNISCARPKPCDLCSFNTLIHSINP